MCVFMCVFSCVCAFVCVCGFLCVCVNERVRKFLEKSLMIWAAFSESYSQGTQTHEYEIIERTATG